MNASPGNRFRGLLLALLLALGMSLSFVQASLMAAEMAVRTQADHAGPGGCDGCSGPGGDADAGTCLSVCASAQGVLPGEPVALWSAPQATFRARYLLLSGRSHSPDPGPPKPFALD